MSDVGAGCFMLGAVFATFMVGVLVLHLHREWKPIIQAYLEARCQQQGSPMRVPPPADEPPGKLYPPFPDEDERRDLDDVL